MHRLRAELGAVEDTSQFHRCEAEPERLERGAARVPFTQQEADVVVPVQGVQANRRPGGALHPDTARMNTQVLGRQQEAMRCCERCGIQPHRENVVTHDGPPYSLPKWQGQQG